MWVRGSRPGHAPHGPILATAALLAAMLGAPLLPAAEVDVGAPFILTDQHGATRTDADFRGSYMLIYFGYTYCPDTCPTSLLKMVEALDALGAREPAKAARIVPILITIDPLRDSPALLKDYASSFSPRLVALTGTSDALRDLAYAYGVFFAKAPGSAGVNSYLIDHTSFTYLMGPDGRYVTHFEKDVSAGDLAAALAARVTSLDAER